MKCGKSLRQASEEIINQTNFYLKVWFDSFNNSFIQALIQKSFNSRKLKLLFPELLISSEFISRLINQLNKLISEWNQSIKLNVFSLNWVDWITEIEVWFNLDWWREWITLHLFNWFSLIWQHWFNCWIELKWRVFWRSEFISVNLQQQLNLMRLPNSNVTELHSAIIHSGLIRALHSSFYSDFAFLSCLVRLNSIPISLFIQL